MEIIKTCIDRHGRIDVLINNAASKSDNVTDFFTSDEDFAAKTWRAVLATNLDGAFFMSQAAGREMLRQGHGNIVNIASIYGIVGPDLRLYDGSEYLGHQISTPAAYSASKAGLLGLTRHLATVWGPRGVRVNAVTPGGIESGQNDRFQKNYGAKVPLGRMATVSEVANAVLFLVSEQSQYLNGHNLVVDGGFSAW
jgi:NAD(P)-dependent dehydrogenase (short-subunit alcohol dehydrogenase family)